MKSILISIRPEWVAKILNKKKTIEIRKTAPKDWKDYLSGKTKIEPKPRTAYLYCTKSNDYELDKTPESGWFFLWDKKGSDAWLFNNHCEHEGWFNGKVVGKFTLRKVEKLEHYTGAFTFVGGIFSTDSIPTSYLMKKKSCLTMDEIWEYTKGNGYAWHISDLEIFDEPKELDEFSYLVRKFHVDGFVVPLYGKVAKAPQSWQYVEVKE